METSYQENKTYLADRSTAIEALPVSTEILIARDPAYAIHSVLKTIDNPLLVLSTYGRAWFKRLVLGSTTARVMQFASYPLSMSDALSCEPRFQNHFSSSSLPVGGTSGFHAVRSAILLCPTSDASEYSPASSRS